MTYAVQSLSILWRWQMAPQFMTSGKPIAYSTETEAQAALDAFLEDDPDYSPDVFRIVEDGFK